MTKKQPELSVLERDLRFFPIKNPSPRKLSHDQIDAFNVNGFLMPFRSYAPEEADRLRTKFDSIISSFFRRGRTATQSRIITTSLPRSTKWRSILRFSISLRISSDQISYVGRLKSLRRCQMTSGVSCGIKTVHAGR